MVGSETGRPAALRRSPSPDAMAFHYRSELPQVRALVQARARAAGLSQERIDDLMLAVSEVAANTLRHTQGPGSLSIWHDDAEIVCEIHDQGVITDLTVGREPPPPGAVAGHGLWLVRQVCDQVELNSDANGTTIRMHMSLNGAVPPDS